MTQPFLKRLQADLHHYRSLLAVVFVFFMAASFSFFATQDTNQSSATSLSQFNPGNIISDAVMSNYKSMTLAEIQAFLTKKNPCNNRDYRLYQEQTRLYPNISWHWEGDEKTGHFVCLSEEKFGEGTEIGTGETAAEIIYAAAQEFKINPQVLIVLLEKEQGLITDTYPHSRQYRSATGYGCPDTAACDSKYFGFKNQIFRAAELFRYTLDNGSYLYPDNQKGVFIGYNPSSSCGGTEVLIENRATSALYRYTPYQPNAAALAAGYGTGNACSAYGNRNFYLYFTDWFGSTQAAVDGEVYIIPDGEYALISTVDQRSAITREDGSVKNGTNVQIAKYDADKTLSFKRNPQDGYYTISDPNSGKVLDLANARTELATNIQLWQYDKNTCAQKWKIYKTKDNYFVIESACMPGMVVELSDQNIELGLAKNKKSQKWQPRFGQVVDDGIYEITTSAKQHLQYAEKNNRNGANIFVDESYEEISERWQLTYHEADDYYTITTPSSKRVLDLSNAQTKNGANIQLWQYDKNTCAQKWHLLQDPTQAKGNYTIISACSLSHTVSFSADRLNVELKEYTPQITTWQFVATEPILSEGDYRVSISSFNNYVFDVSNGGTKNGTNIQGWSLDKNTGAQKWRLRYHPDTDSYSILNPQSDKVLDLSNAQTKNGANIQLWQYDKNTCAQKWFFAGTEQEGYAIHSACNYNYVIDLSNNRTQNGTNIQLWSQDRNTTAQKWHLQPLTSD